MMSYYNFRPASLQIVKGAVKDGRAGSFHSNSWTTFCNPSDALRARSFVGTRPMVGLRPPHGLPSDALRATGAYGTSIFEPILFTPAGVYKIILKMTLSCFI
ncbi:MAG: hypothetical protein K940chlam7_02113 [Chlamydiae bacterium]|nr:hypothetical protein [Chlamydiota bacterium]